MFKEGDIVVAARDEYLDKNETLRDTCGIVLSYNPDNDYLLLGTLHPERYAIPPTFGMRGEYYRLITDEEKNVWRIEDTSEDRIEPDR